MIIDALLDWLSDVIGLLLDALPAGAVDLLNDASVPLALADLSSKASVFGGWFPFALLGAVLGYLFSVRIGMAVVQLGLKVYYLIRGGG